MTDPYQILGVPSSATDDEVKKAYRTLSKKYHPDANINAPNKDELTEKFKEVQNAYDTVMDMRKKGFTGSYQQYQQQAQSPFGNTGYTQYTYANMDDLFNFFRNASFASYGTTGNPEFANVLSYIQAGRYQDALYLLNQMSNQSADWYYYSAICNYNLGNNATALEYAATAVRLDPNNMAYQQLYQNMQYGRTRYRTYSTSYGSPASTYASCCYRILVLNMILSCCCGGRAMPIICC